ncbi:hypothetical protein SAY87_011468 [Trapa incisa]|uniref:Auxin efflux carrier family protein n=1 Tax=Trapa incisa TaxID=236973 RepID=A0AAN7GJA9_9MYRT|nr:hypothetical protein SAY87_011468 [Trapa incisa]
MDDYSSSSSSLMGKVDEGDGALLTAVLPLLKLLCLALIGLILVHPRTQLVPKSTFRLLSKLIFATFLPCLIFTHLGTSISYTNILQWWFIPVNVLLSTGIGFVLGYIVALICRPPPELFRFTIIMTAFGNTGNLPLAIISSVCHSVKNPFGPRCYGSGVAYASFSQWVSAILAYTIVYHMMEPPLEFYEVIHIEENGDEEQHVDDDEIEIEIEIENPEQPEVRGNNDLSQPLLVEAEWLGMEDREAEQFKTPFIARLFNGTSELPLPDSPRSLRCLAEPKVVKKIRTVAEKTPIKHILQPPTIASLLAIVVGVIPKLKSICFGSDAPLSVITDSLDIMAGAMVPSAMLILGGMLAEGPNESKLGTRTMVGIIVARLLVLPLIGIGVMTLADRWDLLIAEDELYRFVLLLQFTVPSAILLGTIAGLRGYAVSEASALLFWQHIFAIFSISLYIFIYMKLVLSSEN